MSTLGLEEWKGFVVICKVAGRNVDIVPFGEISDSSSDASDSYITNGFYSSETKTGRKISGRLIERLDPVDTTKD